ncbi:MAG: MMPL family transporter [Alphaproteobacteria bacterium]|nr:MMPL family transporter [Alphaproteobacteria bacterium]
MKLSVKKLAFVCLFLIAGLALCLGRAPLSVQTNLNSLTEINNTDWPINELTNKFSNVVNIVIKSDNLWSAENTAHAITDVLSTDEFSGLSVINTDVSVSDTLEKLGEHKNSYLGHEYRTLLQNGDFATITNNAVATVSTSFVPTVLSLTDDPFLLTTNYLKELKSTNTNWETRDGFLWQYRAPHHYILISANVDAPDTLVDDIQSLSKTLRKHNDENTSVFMSGVPVHTASMTQTSKLQLSIFSFIALVAAVLLNLLLFRRVATLLPVIVSLSVGFLAGAIALFLLFSQPHILTFVFGVTLIGLGIDYSFHFISALGSKNEQSVRKNILHSFLTTIVCFLPLMFSGLSLLQQISVFTTVGLTAIYLGWLIFMPQKIEIKRSFITMPMAVSKKRRPIVITLLTVAILATLPFMRAQNNMSQLYRPNSELLQAEATMQDLNGVDASTFLLLRGETLDNALATSEQIKDESGHFVDLSTIIPSTERQIENQKLIQQLYKSQSKKIQSELGLRTMPKFTETPPIALSDIQGNKALADLADKFIFDNGEYVYLVANVAPDFTTTNPNAIVVSPAQQMTDLMAEYSHESYRLLAICAVALILLLLAIYGRKAFVYLAPSLLAIGLTAATLTWFGMPITFFHLLSLFIVIGLTLDYSIFHINATNKQEIKPVLFSFLTSLVGFGILGFASFFLIRSMGITLGLGLVFGYLISLFLFRRQN